MDLRNAPDQYKDDTQIVDVAVRHNAQALVYASARLRGDRNFILSLLRDTGPCPTHGETGSCAGTVLTRPTAAYVLAYASAELSDDEELVRAVLTLDPLALPFASVRFRQNRDVVLTAVSKNGAAFQHSLLRSSEELLLVAVRTDPTSARYFDWGSHPVYGKKSKIMGFIVRAGHGGQGGREAGRMNSDKRTGLISSIRSVPQYSGTGAHGQLLSH